MSRYEYRIVPAPQKGGKAKGLRTHEARFAHVLEELMNTMAAQGWEYQRAETLPSIERAGLTGSTTQWRNVLIFRRPAAEDALAFRPQLLPAPAEAPHQRGQTATEIAREGVPPAAEIPFAAAQVPRKDPAPGMTPDERAAQGDRSRAGN